VDKLQTEWPSASRNKSLVMTATVILRENCHVIVSDLVNALSVSVGNAHLHTDLEMKQLCCH
jgi:hypothetical protein